MTDKSHHIPADPNVEPEGYKPPTSAEELLEGRTTVDSSRQSMSASGDFRRLEYGQCLTFALALCFQAGFVSCGAGREPVQMGKQYPPPEIHWIMIPSKADTVDEVSTALVLDSISMHEVDEKETGDADLQPVCGDGQCDTGENQCTCVIDCGEPCADQQCGSDGCGGSCGTCGCGEECVSGLCVFHACDGTECGDNGCGGSCGECANGAECIAGLCKGHVWSASFGGDCSEAGKSVAADSSGNVYVGFNSCSSKINFGGDDIENTGAHDAYLAAFDSNGKHLWSKGFVGGTDDYATEVAVDSSGHVYLTGYFFKQDPRFFPVGPGFSLGGDELPNNGGNDAFVAKFTSMGDHVWSKSYGAEDSDKFNSMAVDASGSTYIAGTFLSETISFGGEFHLKEGTQNTFMVAFDSEGGYVWSYAYGKTLLATLANASDGIYLAGGFQDAIAFGGPELIAKGPQWDVDAFLVRFDLDGSHVWSIGFGGTEQDVVKSLATDSAGNVYVGGYSNSPVMKIGGNEIDNGSSTMLFLAAFNADGDHLWSNAWPNEGGGSFRSLAVDWAGNVVWAGDFSAASINLGGADLDNMGSWDFFLAMFSSEGEHLWSDSWGNDGEDHVHCIAVDLIGNAYLTGSYRSEMINFGGADLQKVKFGQADTYLVKIKL